MRCRSTLVGVLLAGLSLCGIANETQAAKPVELEVLKASIGVWDAEIEVWPQGPDAPSITFKGVETNRAYGEYWIASDFDSTFEGQTIKVHSIVGYDLDKKKMVGKVIDHGPYAATMTGEYDQAKKTVYWTTNAKDLTGNPMLQKTSVTQKNAHERVLVLMTPVDGKGDLTKYMQIRFKKRK